MSKKRDLQREFAQALDSQLRDYKAPKLIRRHIKDIAANICRSLEATSPKDSQKEIYKNVLTLVKFNLGAGVLIGMKMEQDAKPVIPEGYELVPLDPIKDSPAYKM